MNVKAGFVVAVVGLLVLSNAVSGQAFHKGALLLSLSEGATGGQYKTRNDVIGVTHQQYLQGDRDPITLEYGVSDQVGLGLNMGTDIFRVNPGYYGVSNVGKDFRAYMSEVTLDVNYHFLTQAKTDVSCFFSFGFSSLTIDDNIGDSKYKYTAGGGMLRAGIKAKYYFWKRVGILGMASVFSMQSGTDGIKDNTVGNGYTTSIKGWAVEFGPCFRFLKPRK